MIVDLQIKKLSFLKRPIPIPAEYRPMYKIATVVLILKLCCRGERANLLKLHLFSWALSSEKNMDQLKTYITSNFQTDMSVWGIEPALNRGLQLAVADGICEIIDGKSYKLTAKGLKFYDMLKEDKELFNIEKEFLGFIGKTQITDSRITAMTKQWSLFHAEN